jgi:hypothetical protein
MAGNDPCTSLCGGGVERPTPGPSRTWEGRQTAEAEVGDTPKPPDRGGPLSTPFLGRGQTWWGHSTYHEARDSLAIGACVW